VLRFIKPGSAKFIQLILRHWLDGSERNGHPILSTAGNAPTQRMSGHGGMEMHTWQHAVLTATVTGLFVCAALLLTRPASAEDAPRSYIASPDVYKVIAQNDKTRVILVTWPAGKRDQWHSHPATGVYWLTDCKSRVHTPDGKFRETTSKTGSAVVQAPIPSHSFENTSDAECRAIIVEHEQ
jgi:hypothetical protein